MIDLESLSARALARDPARRAIEFEGRWICWGEMRATAQAVDRLIADSGAPSGCVVALVARNRPSAVAALLGLIARGHAIRMIYPFQSPAGVARDVAHVAPAVVIGAAEDLGGEVLETLQAGGVAGIGLEEMRAYALPGAERCGAGHAPPQDPRRIEILTSGTTGAPKPFAVSYDLITAHYVRPDREMDAAEAERTTPALLCFPLGNISGLYSTLPPALSGQQMVQLERWSVEGWRSFVVRHRPAAGGMPPAGVQMVLDADVPKEDLASLRTLSTGAAPLDPEVQRAFEARYGIPILLSYGATEFGGPVAAMTADLYTEFGPAKFGSVGRALPGARLRIVDPETGEPLPAGEEGLLEVVSPRIGPEWIRTSDLAVIDADGFLFHRGRADGAIIRGGFKLLPETIERALLLHPSVAGAAVVGLPDKRLGQVPAAVVQRRPGAAGPTAAELEAHLRAHVLATHIPTAWRVVEELPRTPSFKVDRPAVRRMFEVAEAL